MYKMIIALITAAFFNAMARDIVNPVIEKFGGPLLFHVHFDDEACLPAVAASEQSVQSEFKDARFVPGLLGKALYIGRVVYKARDNLDLSRPGTLLLWIAPHQWKKVEIEPYLFPFIAGTGDTKIILGRQKAPWGKTRLFVNVETAERKDWVNTGIDNTGSGRDWINGEWHMIAVTWTPESVGISVDGSPVQEKTLKKPLAKGTSEWMTLTCQLDDRGSSQILLDEFSILNRKLANDELKALYEETLQKKDTPQ
ncbi:MAG: hypothetical protein PHY82_09640 [Lentisphaeria bacterium]|nr:hypothetical protein [Lentisphaeria bacterium]